MHRTCRRCGVEFVVVEARQDHCFQCAHEVARLIADDERRRTPRFPRASDRTGLVVA